MTPPDGPADPPPRASRVRTGVAVGLLAVAIAAGVAIALRRPDASEAAPPALYTIERDGWHYEYHAVAGTEVLWDLSQPAAARRNVAREQPERTERMREALRREVGVKDLEELRAPHRELYEELKKLGYM